MNVLSQAGKGVSGSSATKGLTVSGDRDAYQRGWRAQVNATDLGVGRIRYSNVKTVKE